MVVVDTDRMGAMDALYFNILHAGQLDELPPRVFVYWATL